LSKRSGRRAASAPRAIPASASTSQTSLAALFERVGELDGIVCTGGAARYKPWDQLTDDDWTFSVANELMGQVNVVRLGAKNVRRSGAITLTSGLAAQYPSSGAAILTTVNSAVEAFVRAVAVEPIPPITIALLFDTPSLPCWPARLPGTLPCDRVCRELAAPRGPAPQIILVLFLMIFEIHATLGFLINRRGGGTESEVGMEGLGRVRGAAARRLWQDDAAGADFRLDPLAPKKIAFAGLGNVYFSLGCS
jgi:Enoyl-(Acyl carrier protein) reductase